MKSVLTRVALVAAVLALSSCITTREEADLIRSDVAQLQTEVSGMKRSQQEERAALEDKLVRMEQRVIALEGTLHSLRQADADSGVQMEKVIQELQLLRGDIEEASFAIGQTQEALGETKKTVTDILARPPIEVQAAETAAPVAAEKPPEAQKIAGLEVPSEKEALYDFALGLHKAGKHAGAIEAFELFLDKHSDDKNLYDNAWFWKGEAWYGLAASLKDDSEQRRTAYKKAILAYNKVIEVGADGGQRSNKEDGALFKIGMAFEALGFTDEPKAFYEEILNVHPASPLAASAKKRLEALSSDSGASDKKSKKKSKKRRRR